MIGPLLCSFFTAADLARTLSSHGPRTYVFEVSMTDSDYFPDGEIVYYLANAESCADHLSGDGNKVSVMGMGMDGEWKNYEGIRSHKNMCQDFADGISGAP